MILNNQLGRRNLTLEQKNYLIGKKYKREKQTHGGDRKSSYKNCNLKTSEKIAQEHKVSHTTVRNAEKFADAIDVVAKNTSEDIKQEILSREIPATMEEIKSLRSAFFP